MDERYKTKCQPKAIYFLIPYFIGVKKGEITLVWEKYGVKETAKAVLSDGDIHDFELGFLIAYYKRVHKDWKPEVLRNKIIEIFDYTKPEELKRYFQTIFFDNCGLDHETAKRFLKYIIKRSEQPTIPIPENFITKLENPKEEEKQK